MDKELRAKVIYVLRNGKRKDLRSAAKRALKRLDEYNDRKNGK